MNTIQGKTDDNETVNLLSLLPFSSITLPSPLSSDPEAKVAEGALRTISNVRTYVVDADGASIVSYTCNNFNPVPDYILAIALSSSEQILRIINLDKALCGQKTLSIFSDECVTDKTYSDARYNTICRSLEIVNPFGRGKATGKVDDRKRYEEYLGDVCCYNTKGSFIGQLEAKTSGGLRKDDKEYLGSQNSTIFTNPAPKKVYNEPYEGNGLAKDNVSMVSMSRNGNSGKLFKSQLLDNVLNGRHKKERKEINEIPSFSESQSQGEKTSLHSEADYNNNCIKQDTALKGNGTDVYNISMTQNIINSPSFSRSFVDRDKMYTLPLFTNKSIQVDTLSDFSHLLRKLKSRLQQETEALEALEDTIQEHDQELFALREKIEDLRNTEHKIVYNKALVAKTELEGKKKCLEGEIELEDKRHKEEKKKWAEKMLSLNNEYEEIANYNKELMTKLSDSKQEGLKTMRDNQKEHQEVMKAIESKKLLLMQLGSEEEEKKGVVEEIMKMEEVEEQQIEEAILTIKHIEEEFRAKEEYLEELKDKRKKLLEELGSMNAAPLTCDEEDEKTEMSLRIQNEQLTNDIFVEEHVLNELKEKLDKERQPGNGDTNGVLRGLEQDKCVAFNSSACLELKSVLEKLKSLNIEELAFNSAKMELESQIVALISLLSL